MGRRKIKLRKARFKYGHCGCNRTLGNPQRSYITRLLHGGHGRIYIIGNINRISRQFEYALVS